MIIITALITGIRLEFTLMQSTNFAFLRPHHDTLANLGGLAEAVLFLDPGSALTRLRGFAEEVTRTIYHLERLPRLPQASFYDLLKDSVFTGCVSRALLDQLHVLRREGNSTAHGSNGDARNAHLALGIAHQIATYMAVRYYGHSLGWMWHLKPTMRRRWIR